MRGSRYLPTATLAATAAAAAASLLIAATGAGATEPPLDEELDPGEATACEPLHELENSIGFCGCGKSPQKLPWAADM